MRVLTVRNVQEALPVALDLLQKEGTRRESRNGPVLQGPAVSTVYQKPAERVIFWAQRDANPFFHLYESLWMLQGRNDVEPLVRYVAKSRDYSDNGVTLHGAYGHRWRQWFKFDQLEQIAATLHKNQDDRRCVLQMWDAKYDGSGGGKDYPCNMIATFQRGFLGELNLVVFCRSNDIIWGAYGANAVQFSTLLEYMAVWIGCPIGTYTQISVNWHAYVDILEQVRDVKPDRLGYTNNPYVDGRVRFVPMPNSIEVLDSHIKVLMAWADDTQELQLMPDHPWSDMVYRVLRAHFLYKTIEKGPEKYTAPLELLAEGDQQADWILAASDWIGRRYKKWMSTTGKL